MRQVREEQNETSARAEEELCSLLRKPTKSPISRVSRPGGAACRIRRK